MKLDFEKVEVTGYTDANIRAAVVGDTTILIVKDYTGQMSVTGFKTPELVIYKTSAVGPTESIDPGFLKSIEELATEAGVVKSADHEVLDVLAGDVAASIAKNYMPVAPVDLQRRLKNRVWRKIGRSKVKVGHVVRWDAGAGIRDLYTVTDVTSDGRITLVKK